MSDLPSTDTSSETVQPQTPSSTQADPVQGSLSARETKSPWQLLGKTQGQRGAEVFAAARAKYDPSPEHRALGKLGAEALVSALVRDPRTVKLFTVRPKIVQALMERALAGIESPLIVEMAAGFLPRGLIMAREHPTWTVIEVDLPDVMAEKQFRFENAGIAIPPNYTLKSADLSVTPLKDLLGDQQPDLVTAEGLMMYFSVEDQQRCAGYVLECLKPGGTFIFDMTWAPGIDPAVGNGDRAVFAESGDFMRGAVIDEAEAYQRYGSLGYRSIKIHIPLQMEAEIPHVPSLTWNTVIMVIAQKAGPSNE